MHQPGIGPGSQAFSEKTEIRDFVNPNLQANSRGKLAYYHYTTDA